MAKMNDKEQNLIPREWVSVIETMRSPLPLPAPVNVVPVINVGAWHVLAFAMQMQRQTYWCWAAVATSVALFYDPASPWTQCLVANGELNRRDCCQRGGANPSCDVTGVYVSSFQLVNYFDHEVNLPLFPTFADIQQEVDARRPLCARIAWSGGGGGHLVAIVGYRVTDQWVAVDDPESGRSELAYATFKSSYQGSGSLTDSYFTRP